MEVAGYRREITSEEVLSQARHLIAVGIPPEARNYKEWAVEVDGAYFGVKWLFSHVTGIPLSKFQSQYARDVMGRRLGLPVVQQPNPNRTAKPSGRLLNTSGETDKWSEIASRKATEIRRFLSGRTEGTPSSEQLCDWVFFCYTFEMYAEGHDLLPHIDRTKVNSWYFEQTQKIAKICANHVQKRTSA